VGYYGGNCSDFLEGGLSNISWFYDWGHDQESLARSGCPTSTQKNHNVAGVEYVPQIWGKYALKNISNMNTTFIQGARFIFSFNEPDHSGSSWLPPEEGAARWPDMVALARAFNLTLVAPCVSNYASGDWWLSTWHAACKNLTGHTCPFDHTCLHTYFDPSQTSSLFSSLERMYNDYKSPIWLNEFACPPVRDFGLLSPLSSIMKDLTPLPTPPTPSIFRQYKNCSSSNQLTFMKSVVPRLESLNYIFRYAWFEARSAGGESLLVNPPTSPASLTPLGDWYNKFF